MDSGPGSERVRFIRDPIHRDIRLDPLESSVVNTRIFQRLRYIRQNGLLHLVFPGAVHTRFAHSLGTMDIARRVASSLFGPVLERSSCSGLSHAVEYLSQSFRLAALLHDVGHGAFSHSIEHTKLRDGTAFLGTTEQLFNTWGEQELLKKYAASRPSKLSEPVTHEQIGLVLVAAIFADPRVVDVCSRLSMDATELCRDVQALMDGSLSFSARFQESSTKVARAVTREERQASSEGVAQILHGLVSGTLDVDRLDYLVRDSFHCGVPYGTCEVHLLVKSLSIGVVDGKVNLLLDWKAAHALDDLLWSRYQLFLQVLNHKTNVGLNAALGEAVREARAAGYIQSPKSTAEYVSFIDDRIIGTMFELAQKPDTELDDRPFIQLFVDRRVPRHLALHKLARGEDLEDFEEEIREKLAREHSIDPARILVGTAKSELVKPSQHLPHVMEQRSRKQEPFEAVSTVLGEHGVGSEPYRVLHFFST